MLDPHVVLDDCREKLLKKAAKKDNALDLSMANDAELEIADHVNGMPTVRVKIAALDVDVIVYLRKQGWGHTIYRWHWVPLTSAVQLAMKKQTAAMAQPHGTWGSSMRAFRPVLCVCGLPLCVQEVPLLPSLSPLPHPLHSTSTNTSSSSHPWLLPTPQQLPHHTSPSSLKRSKTMRPSSPRPSRASRPQRTPRCTFLPERLDHQLTVPLCSMTMAMATRPLCRRHAKGQGEGK